MERYSTMGKCVFNRKWPTEQIVGQNKSSVREFKSDKHIVICCFCNKVIDLGKMGEHALKSRMKSEKHIQCTPATTTTPIAATLDPIHSACSASELTIPIPTDDPQSGNILPTQANTATLDLFVSRNDTLKAEILWTLHTVLPNTAHLHPMMMYQNCSQSCFQIVELQR